MPNTKRPAVFVDRDNTLIHDPGYLRHADHVRLLPGVGEAVAKLRSAGLPVVVVTNQSGVARGYLTEAELASVHERMQELLQSSGSGVDAIYYCPFLTGPDAVVEEYRKDSDMRKPKPGMLLQAADDLRIDLSASWMIGDSERDILAGKSVGCKTILIGNGRNNVDPPPDFTAASFAKAAEIVLREAKPRPQRAVGSEANPVAVDVVNNSTSDARPTESDRRENKANVEGAIQPDPPATKSARTVEAPSRKNSDGVTVKSAPAIRVADPQVRILEPSAAAAHRNRVESPADVPATSVVPSKEQAPKSSVIESEAWRADVLRDAPAVKAEIHAKAPAAHGAADTTESVIDQRETPDSATSESVRTPSADAPRKAAETTSKEAGQWSSITPPAVNVPDAAPYVPEHLRMDPPKPAPEPTLGQLLEELRSMKREQRFNDFSFPQLAGAIAQAFAVCALTFGLYASINGDTASASFRVLLAVAFQLMALTGFISRRRS